MLLNCRKQWISQIQVQNVFSFFFLDLRVNYVPQGKNNTLSRAAIICKRCF